MFYVLKPNTFGCCAKIHVRPCSPILLLQYSYFVIQAWYPRWIGELLAFPAHWYNSFIALFGRLLALRDANKWVKLRYYVTVIYTKLPTLWIKNSSRFLYLIISDSGFNENTFISINEILLKFIIFALQCNLLGKYAFVIFHYSVAPRYPKQATSLMRRAQVCLYNWNVINGSMFTRFLSTVSEQRMNINSFRHEFFSLLIQFVFQ